MRIKKRKKNEARYLPLADIEKINDEFLTEMERVKRRLGYVKDPAIITAFHEVLLSAYRAAIELRACECEVDYDIKFAEIEERSRNLKPWRRSRLWRLLFQPITNRAQDIIEERAELNANLLHLSLENEIAADRKKLPANDKTKRKIRAKIKEVLKQADNADMNETFAEPQTNTQQESAENQQELQEEQTKKPPRRRIRKKPDQCEPETKQKEVLKQADNADMNETLAEPQTDSQQKDTASEQKQLPGQLSINELPLTQVRRARPPRSCRKPSKSG